MTDEGAINLLIAITERAYKDYIIGLKLRRTNFRKRTHNVTRMMHEFETAKLFLEDTKVGDYLIGQAEKTIKERRKNEKVDGH